MKGEEEIAQLKKEKAEVERQLEVALRRIVELEEMLRRQEKAFQEQLEQAKSQIEDLKGRLGKDSHNSHKPPSSDGLGRRSHSKRKPGERKSGGQKGHSGETCSLAEKVDEVITHRPERCGHCGESLKECSGEVVERRQVHDLPPMQLIVQEHQIEEVCCPQCQWANRGCFPEQVKAIIQYGPQVRAWAVYLNQQHLVPMERTCQIMREGLGCSISEGTLANWNEQASESLEPTMEKIKSCLKVAGLLHLDETGIRIGKKLHWLHTTCTRWLTYLQWHQKRGREALESIGILPGFAGRVMRDRMSSYDHYPCEQSLCGSHLCRDASGLFEQTNQEWALKMERALRAMNKVAHYWRNQRAKSVPRPIRDRWVARYFHILACGYAAQPPPTPKPETIPKRKGPPKQTPAMNLLDAFLHRADQILAFLDDLSIPFTNNQAERDLRMAKVQQKISGTFRAQDGATCFCRIRSYLSTMSKQGHPLLEALVALFNGHPLPIACSF
jgi:transposase